MGWRPYRDEGDLEAMCALLVAGRQAGGPVYYVHVGDLNWWIFFLLQGLDREENIWLWDNEAGGLAGWALFSPRFQAFDVFVHPAALGRRAEMVDWAVERITRQVRSAGGRVVQTIWVAEEDLELVGLLERLGFHRSDLFLLQLERTLDHPIGPQTPPPGWEVRPVQGEAELETRALASHQAFGPRRPYAEYLESYLAFVRSPGYPAGWDLVATPGDSAGPVAAFCIAWLDPVNRIGLFEPVGTRPDFRGRGLGKAVLLDGLRRMQQAGMDRAMVCVESDNPAAQRLYQSAGFWPRRALHTFVRPVGE